MLAVARGQVTAWRAGHVLGAAMFTVEIAGMRLLYTGDYSRLADRHMPPADLPHPPPHIGARAHTPASRRLGSCTASFQSSVPPRCLR